MFDNFLLGQNEVHKNKQNSRSYFITSYIRFSSFVLGEDRFLGRGRGCWGGGLGEVIYVGFQNLFIHMCTHFRIC